MAPLLNQTLFECNSRITFNHSSHTSKIILPKETGITRHSNFSPLKTKREAYWSETKGCPQRPEGSSCKRILVFLTFYSASFGSQTLDRLSRVATSDHVHRCRAFPADPSRFCLCSHPTGVGCSPRSSNLLHSLGWSLLLSHRSIFTPGHRTANGVPGGMS